jgi:cell division protein FtsW
MDDSIYRLRHRDILTLCVMALLTLGVLMVQSASINITGQTGWHWSERGTKHVEFALIALAVYFIVGHLNYARLVPTTLSIVRNPITWLLLVSMFSCVLVLVPHIGMEVNGARRWIKLGPVQVQPSEMAKWAIVLFLAWWMAYRPVDLNTFRGFVVTLVPIGLTCLLVVIQDFGTAALIGVCSLTILLAGRIKVWHLLIVLPPVLLAAFYFVHHSKVPGQPSYRWRRITAFLDPYAAPQGDGYHMIQSLLSFTTGGIFGKGLGNGIQKLGYLPEDTTDFIFSVICEELGLFGAMLTVALYLGIIYVAWQVVMQKNRDSFGRLLAFGVGSMIGFQALINIAVATVSAPTKGLSLPLVSAGGSGLVITCAALGLLYSVTRFEENAEAVGEDDESLPALTPKLAA